MQGFLNIVYINTVIDMLPVELWPDLMCPAILKMPNHCFLLCVVVEYFRFFFVICLSTLEADVYNVCIKI